MRTVRGLGLMIGTLAGDTFGANFTMVAVGSFGEPLTECRVESFQPVRASAKGKPDYKGRFHDLAADNIPDGEYSAEIKCRETRIGRYVEVSNLDVFRVVSQNRRLMRSDPPPSLLIRFNSACPRGETWWLTAKALYAERADTVKFDGDTGQAAIIDPDTGSYVISVLSSTGYGCVREIDLVERTRLWTFDPAGCDFHVDEFAHIVTNEHKRSLKTTDWYQQRRKSEEELRSAMERLIRRARDS